MTDWKDLVEEDGEHNLFLKVCPDNSGQVNSLLEAISGQRKELKILPPSYYKNLIVGWKDKLLRYPLAVGENHPVVTLYGLDYPVPLAFLDEMKERFIETETACSLRNTGTDLPFLCHYVSPGSTLVACDAGGISNRRVQEHLSVDKSSVAVQHEEEKLTYKARISGYMIYGKEGLRVMPPLIEEDEPFALTARLIPLVSGTSSLTMYLNESLEKHLKRFPGAPRPAGPLTEEVIRQQGLYTYRELALIKGNRPEEGKDSRLVILRNDSGGEEKGGAVDYRNICHIHTAGEGEVIAVKVIPIPGKDGLDIYGKKYPVRQGQDQEVRYGENIRQEEGDGVIRYIAEVTGVVAIKDNVITLDEAMVIEGDVDYSTGNVRYEKNVHVKGDVRSGFSVSCRGDLLIEGGVEEKVRVDCLGSVKIGKGVIGRSTSVQVGGDLVCGFIERSHILCRGDLTVERNILGGQISCVGNLAVTGKGLSGKKNGALSGAVCRCYRSMSVLSLGAEANRTTVHMGFNPLIDNKIKEVDEVLNGFNIKLSQLMGKLPFDLTAPDAPERLKKVSSETREKVKQILLQVKKLNSEVSAIKKGKRSLTDKRFNENTNDFSLTSSEGIKGMVNLCYGRDDISEEFTAQGGKLLIKYNEFTKTFSTEP